MRKSLQIWICTRALESQGKLPNLSCAQFSPNIWSALLFPVMIVYWYPGLVLFVISENDVCHLSYVFPLKSCLFVSWKTDTLIPRFPKWLYSYEASFWPPSLFAIFISRHHLASSSHSSYTTTISFHSNISHADQKVYSPEELFCIPQQACPRPGSNHKSPSSSGDLDKTRGQIGGSFPKKVTCPNSS